MMAEKGSSYGLLVGPVFILLAAWLVWGPDLTHIPKTEAALFDTTQLITTPRRQMLKDPPVILIDGFRRTCMDCHMIFPAREVPPDQLMKHRHIVLDHGINDQCRNCHHGEDRDRLALRSGETIGYSEVVRLCQNCHGPTYRDWERGMHGRTNGFWDSTLGKAYRLSCTECHDPHLPRHPAMDPLAPLPGPHTLRMGTPIQHGPETGGPIHRAIEERH